MTIAQLAVARSDGTLQGFAPQIVAGQVYRILTDPEVTDWQGKSILDGEYHKYQSRTANVEWRKTHPFMATAPQTVRVQLANGKTGFSLPEIWQQEVERLNPYAFGYLTRGGSGWVNKDTWPAVQALLFRNDRAFVEQVDGQRAWLRHLDLAGRPPATYDETTLHAFTVITEQGETILPDPPGVPAWMPLVSPCPLWIDTRQLYPLVGNVPLPYVNELYA